MSNWIDLGRAVVSDNAQQREVVLVDRRGQPLIVREPRKVGFRPPAERPVAQGDRR